ncbi:response regulator transcription factor [Paraconexibacter antarcticus]|uniref:Response regulator transcription factor n=1 Tax=Paraconexibacter antarcticus TaxID=2949664 RepID=A0ABY5DZZ8_9ACTN|nr:response regulator transcription factor [Paraconexibacter antarcticus]UTI67105.1 response regulator transcription factor [Paraconexibacter antarcticus]
MRVLVVEDDPRLSELLLRTLRAEGLLADAVATGALALDAAQGTAYDVVILDVGLPDTDGFAVCAEFRHREMWAPVLMLTARTAVGDRVAGLDAGADDYLAKPFAIEELLARLRALGRRGPVSRAPVLCVGDLRLNPATHEAWRGEVPVDLSPRELALLEAFMRHPGQVLSRETLLDQAWPMAGAQRSNVVEVYVRYLREKIDRPFGVASLENVRGAGYRLRRDGGA